MSHKCLVLALVISLAALATAQIPNVGFCPEYLPMTDFDMERFLGKWYEAERYFTFSEVVSRCVVTDYARAPSGRIYVSNEVINRLTGVKRIINGNLQVVGKGDEGKIHVKYANTPIPTETTLTVLETDYDNFAVVWSCSGFGPIHAQNAWLMTRDRLPSGNVLQKAYGVLDKFKISRTFFVKTDQEGCFLAASDINAANGITATSTVPEATGSEQREESLRNAPLVANAEQLVVEGAKEPAKLPAKFIPEPKPVTLAEHILQQEQQLKQSDESKEVQNDQQTAQVSEIETKKVQVVKAAEEPVKAEAKPEKKPEPVEKIEDKKPEEAKPSEAKKPEEIKKKIASDEKPKSHSVKS